MSRTRTVADDVCRLLERNLDLARKIRDAGTAGEIDALHNAMSPRRGAISRTNPPEPRGPGSPNERPSKNENEDFAALDDLERQLDGLLKRLAKARERELPEDDDKLDAPETGA